MVIISYIGFGFQAIGAVAAPGDQIYALFPYKLTDFYENWCT